MQMYTGIWPELVAVEVLNLPNQILQGVISSIHLHLQLITYVAYRWL